MNAKTLIVMAVILVALAGAYFLMGDNRVVMDPPQKLQIKRGKQVFPQFDKIAVRALTIRQGETRLRLEKRDADRWTVASKEHRLVEPSPIARLFSGLENVKVVDVRNGPLEKFTLDEGHRMEMEVLGEGDKSLLKAWVGKSPEYGTCFVRLPEEDRVLEVDQDLESKLGAKTKDDRRVLAIDYWYDLTIMKFDRADVEEIEIKRDQELVRISRISNPKWKAEKDRKEGGEEKTSGTKSEEPEFLWKIMHPTEEWAEESACRSICATASLLFAKGYADDVKAEDRGLDHPTAVTTLKLKGGDTHTFVFGKVTDQFVVLQVKGRPEFWKIEAFNFEGMVKSYEKLKLKVEKPRMETIAKPFVPDEDSPSEKLAPEP